MDTLKTVLIATLLFLSYLLWQEWNNTFPSHIDNNSNIIEQERAGDKSDNIKNSVVPVVSYDTKKSSSISNASSSYNNDGNSSSAFSNQKLITVTTDLVEYKINPVGGDIVGVKLLKYNKSEEDKSPEVLLNNNPKTLYIAPNGLTGKNGPDTPTKRAEYSYNKLNYDLSDLNNNQIKVDLFLNNNIKVVKSFVFTKDKYEVDINYNITNNSDKNWDGFLFSVLKRKDVENDSGSMFMPSAYMGLAAYNTQEKFHKIAINKLTDGPKSWETKNGWAAMVQHYFLSTWIPNNNDVYQYTASDNKDGSYSVSLVSPNITVAPNTTVNKNIQFYAGPELTENLSALAEGLDRTVDYGILWPIAKVIFWGMKQIYNAVGNWGWAIILITLVIKALFYKLASSSYRSMAKLRLLAPKVEQLKRKFGDDREKMGKAMMELYKKEKVNPLGGCLPMLVQLPFFIALYWVIIESVELRQAPFALWITDLSARDPYFILPILMGISMFGQQKLSPAPADPSQAKVMMMMPVFFTALFLYFPSGLVLYWVVNTIASIAQQWLITRSVENAGLNNIKNKESLVKNSKNNKNKIDKLDFKKFNTNKKAVNDCKSNSGSSSDPGEI